MRKHIVAILAVVFALGPSIGYLGVTNHKVDVVALGPTIDHIGLVRSQAWLGKNENMADHRERIALGPTIDHIGLVMHFHYSPDMGPLIDHGG